ncbi:Hypothetical protein ADU73_1131 [Pediococcus damnosus]|nr:Hypothetical protein ADU73_1131 [Pediococcus damnosus]
MKTSRKIVAISLHLFIRKALILSKEKPIKIGIPKRIMKNKASLKSDI